VAKQVEKIWVLEACIKGTDNWWISSLAQSPILKKREGLKRAKVLNSHLYALVKYRLGRFKRG
jgi:hypothetical protein